MDPAMDLVEMLLAIYFVCIGISVMVFIFACLGRNAPIGIFILFMGLVWGIIMSSITFGMKEYNEIINDVFL